MQFLCITEIGVKLDILQNIVIPGFNLGSQYCRTNKLKGGVAIWVKQQIDVVEIDLSKYCIEQDFEICAVSYEINKCKFVIANCYRSPSGNVDIFFTQFKLVIEYIFKPSVHYTVCGDFNFDLYTNSNFNVLCSLMSCLDIRPTVGWPTRVTNNTCTIIDQIFTSDPHTCFVFDNQLSDHRTVLLERITNTHKKKQSTSEVKRLFSETNMNDFQEMIHKEQWTRIYQVNCFEKAFDIFYNILCYNFELCFPKRKYYQKLNKGWMNTAIKESSASLKHLYHLKKSDISLIDVYNKAKKDHVKLIKDTKKRYYHNRIMNAENDSKALWNVVSEITNKRKANSNIAITKEGELIEQPHDVVNNFNSYFLESPKVLLSHIKTSDDTVVVPINDFNSHSMYLQPFNEMELYNLLISKIKNRKSSGMDEIAAFVMKKVLHIIMEPITYLVNMSFEQGIFPSKMKLGKVTPIQKNNKLNSIENFRPVTVPQTLSKIFEYSYLERMLCFINKHNILNSTQHGFRSGKSTQSALLHFYNTLVNFINDGECPAAVFCDLSRAFDCVNHLKLLDILESYGFRGKPLNWLKSFLENRSQCVSLKFDHNNSVSHVTSEIGSLCMGVPQGSILGPILFLLYVNRFENNILHSDFVAYADDISILKSTKNTLLLKQETEKLLDAACTFFNNHDLYFNAKKTQVIRFHNYKQPSAELQLDFNNTVLSDTDTVKFLGIYFDKHINWVSHCESLISKLHSSYYMFKNLKTVLDVGQLVNVYYGQIESRLRYGICLWGISTKSKDVFTAQKAILRCIFNIPRRETCKSIFKCSNILTLASLYIFEISCYIYCNKSYFKLNKDIHNMNTRQKGLIHTQVGKYKITQNAPNYMGPRIFNHLSEHIKSSLTIKLFKMRLKTFLVQNSFYTVQDFLNCPVL